MQNVLIPTCYGEDTLHAIEKALLINGNEPFEIVLLRVTPMPDSIMDFLASGEKRKMPKAFHSKLEEFRENFNVVIREHDQYGASYAVLDQIIMRYKIKLIILPNDFQKSHELIDQEAMRALKQTPIRVIPMSETVLRDSTAYYHHLTTLSAENK